MSENDEITLKIKGQGIFRYEDGTTKELPIDCSYPIELSEKLVKLKYALKNFEEWKENIYDKIKEKIDEIIPDKCIEDTYGDVICVNPENPKVGKATTITIMNPETNEPVQGVRVWSDIIPLGKTDDYGEIEHRFLKSGYHKIKVIIGDTEYWRDIYVSGLLEDSNDNYDDSKDTSSDEYNNNPVVLIFDALIDVYPENPKVGEKVIITITDQYGYPVDGVDVYSNGDYIGTTDENGQLTHRYLTSGEHEIKVDAVKDDAEYEGTTVIYVSGLFR